MLLPRSVRTIFTIAAIGMALANPIVAIDKIADLQLEFKPNKDLIEAFNATKPAHTGTITAPKPYVKFQENYALRLVDALNEFDAIRRRRYAKTDTPIKPGDFRLSISSKKENRPLQSAIVDRPAWYAPDPRQAQHFPFIAPAVL